MAALVPWRPMRELERMEREMDKMFDRMSSPFASFWEPERAMGTTERGLPAIESHVEDGNLIVKADLPGIDPKEVSISVMGNQLTIEGERKHEKKEEKGDYFYREVAYGKFSRTMTLPAGVDADKVKASYKDGVLQITMPTPKEMASKRIQIEAK